MISSMPGLLLQADQLLQPVDVVVAVDEVRLADDAPGAAGWWSRCRRSRTRRAQRRSRIRHSSRSRPWTISLPTTRRSTAGSCSRRRGPNRRARRGRPARWQSVTVPGEGTKVSGSSALIRHSMAWPSKTMSSWRERQRLAGGDADLLAHEVDAGDQLGDRVLDLEAGVHLDEVELAVLVQELEGAGAAVAELAHAVGRAARRSCRAARR